MLFVSPIYSGFLVVLIIFLAYRVTGYRRTEGIPIGDTGASKAMKRAIRTHANSVENIPLGIILLMILELNNLTPWLLHSCGSVLLLSRFSYAWGMYRQEGASSGRFFGTLFTWLCLLLMVIINMLLIFTRV